MMNESKTTKKLVEVKLAVGLLEIASLAMPDSYYQSDRRCKLARKILKTHGVKEP